MDREYSSSGTESGDDDCSSGTESGYDSWESVESSRGPCWCPLCNIAFFDDVCPYCLESRGPRWCPLCNVAFFFDDVCPYCLDSTDSPPPSPPCPSFNPLIVLPGGGQRQYDLHYHDTAGGWGLRRLPPAMAQSLLGSGLESFLDRLWAEQIAGGSPRTLPTVHVDDSDSLCAVCTDAFAPGSEALEMPCSHRYHAGCILSWLRLRWSCPVCREELPIDTVGVFGLALWRQPRLDELVVGSFVGDFELPTALYRHAWIAKLDDGGEGSGIEWRFPPIRRRSGGGLLQRFLGKLGMKLGFLSQSWTHLHY